MKLSEDKRQVVFNSFEEWKGYLLFLQLKYPERNTKTGSVRHLIYPYTAYVDDLELVEEYLNIQRIL